MSSPKPQPSAKFLHECFHYDPFTGELTWKARPEAHFNNRSGWLLHDSRQKGQIAGTIGEDKNRKIRLDGRNFQATRIIWKMQTGKEPEGFILTVNGINGDNRWKNLRLMPTRTAVPEPTDSNQAIYFNRYTDKWVVFIKNGFYHNIGYFEHYSQAVLAYESAML